MFITPGLYSNRYGNVIEIVKNHDGKLEKKNSDGMEIYTIRGVMMWWSQDKERYFASTDLKTDLVKRI